MPTSANQAIRVASGTSRTYASRAAVAGVLLTVAGVACSSSPTVDENAAVDTPFAVSDYFAPSGFMGDGTTVGAVDVKTTECMTPRPPGARGDCYKVTYAPIGAWAGVYWQYPADNWGAKAGKKITPGATKLTFWAAGSKGGEKIDFKVGGIEDETLPFHDTFKAETSEKLTSAWVKYEVNFGPKGYGDVIGGFSWSMSVTGADASGPPTVFYLDGLTWGE